MSVITDLYQRLFGKNHIQDGTVIDMAEHGRVGGLSTGQPFKFVSTIDPNNGAYIGADSSTSGTLSGLNEIVQLDLHGMGSCVVQVSGTWSGKIEFQGAIDGTWNTLSIFQPTGAITRNGIQNDNQNGLYRIVIVSAYTKVRAIMTTYTSGSASILFNASTAVGSTQVWQLNQANLLSTVYQTTASNLNANVTSNGANLATAANQATANTLLGGIAGFTPAVYDYISLSYTGANLTGVVFKTGGSGGTTVSTLTLAYDGSNNLTSVTKS